MQSTVILRTLTNLGFQLLNSYLTNIHYVKVLKAEFIEEKMYEKKRLWFMKRKNDLILWILSHVSSLSLWIQKIEVMVRGIHLKCLTWPFGCNTQTGREMLTFCIIFHSLKFLLDVWDFESNSVFLIRRTYTLYLLVCRKHDFLFKTSKYLIAFNVQVSWKGFHMSQSQEGTMKVSKCTDISFYKKYHFTMEFYVYGPENI